MTGVEAPRQMEGADLSRIFKGRDPSGRAFAYGGYRNSHYLRNDRWTFFADNRMKTPSCTTAAGTPRSCTTSRTATQR